MPRSKTSKLAKGSAPTRAEPARKAQPAKAAAKAPANPPAKAPAKPAAKTNAVAALKKLVPPPKAPVDPPEPAQWTQHEKQLGTALPADYKAMIETYGTGRLDDFIWLANPFSKTMKWSSWFEKALAALRELRPASGKKPTPVFPEPGGVMPWASTENANFFTFRTGGPPDTWPIVIFESRGPRFDELPTTATAALVALLSREHRSPYLRESFPPRKHAFTPLGEQHKTSIEVALDPRPFADRLAILRKHVTNAKVEQSYTGEAIVRIPGTAIELTYRDCNQADDGRTGAEIFAVYAAREEAEVRKIISETVAAAGWQLGAVIDFKTRKPRWNGKP